MLYYDSTKIEETMKMLTSIGKFLRKVRIDNNEILLNMANKLGVSSSFLSAVENGKKKIPADWNIRICELYGLDEIQCENLDQAIAETEQSYEIDLSGVSQSNREVAVSFARKFASMDESQIEQIKKILGTVN